MKHYVTQDILFKFSLFAVAVATLYMTIAMALPGSHHQNEKSNQTSTETHQPQTHGDHSD